MKKVVYPHIPGLEPQPWGRLPKVLIWDLVPTDNSLFFGCRFANKVISASRT